MSEPDLGQNSDLKSPSRGADHCRMTKIKATAIPLAVTLSLLAPAMAEAMPYGK
jgi:hypothetical protein